MSLASSNEEEDRKLTPEERAEEIQLQSNISNMVEYEEESDDYTGTSSSSPPSSPASLTLKKYVASSPVATASISIDLRPHEEQVNISTASEQKQGSSRNLNDEGAAENDINPDPRSSSAKPPMAALRRASSINTIDEDAILSEVAAAFETSSSMGSSSPALRASHILRLTDGSGSVDDDSTNRTIASNGHLSPMRRDSTGIAQEFAQMMFVEERRKQEDQELKERESRIRRLGLDSLAMDSEGVPSSAAAATAANGSATEPPKQLMAVRLPPPTEVSYQTLESRQKRDSDRTSIESAASVAARASAAMNDLNSNLGAITRSQSLPGGRTSESVVASASATSAAPAPPIANRAISMTGAIRVRGVDYKYTEDNKSGWDSASERQGEVSEAFSINDFAVDKIEEESHTSNHRAPPAAGDNSNGNGEVANVDDTRRSGASHSSGGRSSGGRRRRRTPTAIEAIRVEEEEQRLQERVDALERQITTTSWIQPTSLPPISSAVVSATSVRSVDDDFTLATAATSIHENKDKKCSFWWWPFGLICLFGSIGGVVTIIALLGGGNDGTASPSAEVGDGPSIGNDPTSTTPGAPTASPVTGMVPLAPTLEIIRERGSIVCRTESFERRQGFGFSLDLVSIMFRSSQPVKPFVVFVLLMHVCILDIQCRALSAAIFDGDASRTEFPTIGWGDQWSEINEGRVDISTSQATHTMQRDVLQPQANAGMSFSTPYLYTGTLFAGVPELVACAEAGETLLGVCAGLDICVIGDSTNELVVRDHLDGSAFQVVFDSPQLFSDLTAGKCNVLAGDPSLIYEARVREEGYIGEYVFGSKLFSKEPLAMVTRGDDPEFSDFVEYFLQALITAEAVNITQSNAFDFPTIDLFGPEYTRMFQHAIASVGNYGEMYERHIEERFPRSGLNLLDDNDGSGQLYANPFSNVLLDDTSSVGPTNGGTLEKIEGRSLIVCGVLGDRPWLNIFNDAFAGLDVEYCRALSAALFNGNINQLAIIRFNTAEEAFESLADGLIDVFASASYTMENNVREPTTGVGFTLSTPYFYEPGEDCVAYSLATREDDSQWSDFVQWVFWSTIYAEEEGISTADATQLPTVDLFGDSYIQMFRFVSLGVGNYGDMYERTVEELVPRSGRNRLNSGGPKLIPWLKDFVLEARDTET